VTVKLQAVPLVDFLTPTALATGCINTTFLRPSSSFPSPPHLPTSSSASLAASSLLHIGTNTDCTALTSVLLSALVSLSTPFPPSAPHSFSPHAKAAAFTIGGGGAVRAAIYSLSHDLGCSPIFLVNRDEDEMRAVVQHFPKVDVRPLRSVEEAEKQLNELQRGGGKLILGVGAVPCCEPKTEEEKTVYAVVETLFRSKYSGAVDEVEAGSLSLPDKPVFVGAFIIPFSFPWLAEKAPC
jgi:quinate dehydrogenase